MTESTDLDRVDRAIVNAFQGGFPIIEEPFETAASALTDAGVAVDGDQLIERIRRLDEEGVLSRFGPLINANEIGGVATLVAMSVPQERFDAVAERVNDYPEVAHNYERDHDLNMWFVVSVVEPGRVDAVLAAIEDETGLETYNMPKQREFYLEARFPVDGPLQDGLDLSGLGPDPDPVEQKQLSKRERTLLVEIQDGIPLAATPYADVADRIDASPSWVRETLARFTAEGKIRRIGCIPNHYALGYTENAMTVWDVDDEDVEAVGEAVGALPFVTHCYERPRHEPLWTYNLFAMVHGRSEAECQQRLEQVRETVSQGTADPEWEVLYSTRILKKSGLRLTERVKNGTLTT